MEKIRIRRTGKKDLVFTGQLLACGDDKEGNCGRSPWIDASLYKTVVGKYILGFRIHLSSPRERQVHKAMSFTTPEDAMEFINTLFENNVNIHKSILDHASLADMAFKSLRKGQQGRVNPREPRPVRESREYREGRRPGELRIG